MRTLAHACAIVAIGAGVHKVWTPVQKACSVHAMDARDAIMSNLAAAVDADPRKDAFIAEAMFPRKKPKAAINTLNRMLDGECLTVANLDSAAHGLGIEVDGLTSTAKAAARAALETPAVAPGSMSMSQTEMVTAGTRASRAAEREFGSGWSRLSVDARRGAIASHVVATFESFGESLSAGDMSAVMRIAWTVGGADLLGVEAQRS